MESYHFLLVSALVLLSCNLCASQESPKATCMTITSCVSGLSDLMGDMSNQNIPAMCQAIEEMDQCIKDAIADCRQQNIMSPEDIQRTEDNLKQSFKSAADLCSGGPKGGSETSCIEIQSCYAGMSGEDFSLSGSPNPEELRALCQKLDEMSKCVNDALADCRGRNVIPEEELQDMQQQFMNSQKAMMGMCAAVRSGGSGTGGMPDSPDNSDTLHTGPKRVCQDMESCGFRPKDIEELQKKSEYAEACRIIKEADQCTREALEDCRRTNMIPKDQLDQIQAGLKNNAGNFAVMCAAFTESQPSGGSEGTGKMSVVVDNSDNANESESGSSGTYITGTETEFPSDPKCENVLECLQKLPGILQMKSSKTKTCTLVKQAVACLRPAIGDCETEGTVPEAQIKDSKSKLKMAEKYLQQKCGSQSQSESQGGDNDGATGLQASLLTLAFCALVKFGLNLRTSA